MLVQELMGLCWHPNPDLRPDMHQCKQWASSNEFERLRANIILGDVSSVACACVSHIDPNLEEEGEKKPLTTASTEESEDQSAVMSREIETQLSDSDFARFSLRSKIIQAQEEEEWELIQGPPSRLNTDSGLKSTGDTCSYVTDQEQEQRSPDRTFLTHKEEVRKRETREKGADPYTQVWMCGRDKKKGLLAVFLFPDNQKSYSVRCYWNPYMGSTIIHIFFCPFSPL